MFNNEMHWNGMNRRRHFNDESGASNSITSRVCNILGQWALSASNAEPDKNSFLALSHSAIHGTLMYLINEYSLNYLQCLAPRSCQS